MYPTFGDGSDSCVFIIIIPAITMNEPDNAEVHRSSKAYSCSLGAL